MVTGFNPAISRDALTKIGAQVRSWGLHRKHDLSAADLARWVNPVVRGWMNYYGAFYRSALYPRQIQPVEAFESTSSVNNSEGFFQL
jgi:hypothetical protein